MAEDAAAPAGKPKGGMVPVIAGVGLLTLAGAGGGWLLGGLIAPPPAKPAPAPASEAEIPSASTAESGIVLLEPITTNLAYPSESWVRLEVALAFNGAPEPSLAEAVHQDIMAFMRTVSLQQIAGPRGFQYLREDIEERASLRSEGKVSKILFRSFVIE